VAQLPQPPPPYPNPHAIKPLPQHPKKKKKTKLSRKKWDPSFSSKGKNWLTQVFPHELITQKNQFSAAKFLTKSIHNVVGSLRLLEALLTKGNTGLG